jgi:hypothetical protein
VETWLGSEDLVQLARRRADVFVEIERLLQVRDLIGNWVGDQEARYRTLCREEQALFDQMITLTDRADAGAARP